MEAAISAEKSAQDKVRAFVRANADELQYIVRWGDGYGGYIEQLFCEELGIEPIEPPHQKAKARIPRWLSKQVFERGAYRCVACGSHIDLTCDHIYPESKGGETTLENLQTMCRSCNCKKGAK